jgi:hypothetical protein
MRIRRSDTAVALPAGGLSGAWPSLSCFPYHYDAWGKRASKVCFFEERLKELTAKVGSVQQKDGCCGDQYSFAPISARVTEYTIADASKQSHPDCRASRPKGSRFAAPRED